MRTLERRLVGLEKVLLRAAFDNLVGQHSAAGLDCGLLGRLAGIVVFWRVPDAGMGGADNLVTLLAHKFAKPGIDLVMHAPHILEPDKIRHAVDQGVQPEHVLGGVGIALDFGEQIAHAQANARHENRFEPDVVNAGKIPVCQGLLRFRIHTGNQARSGAGLCPDFGQASRQGHIQDGQFGPPQGFGIKFVQHQNIVGKPFLRDKSANFLRQFGIGRKNRNPESVIVHLNSNNYIIP